MRISISKNRSSLESGDKYFVLSREVFFDYVDLEDFECRKSNTIEPAYHRHWFEAETMFLPPIMYFKDGKIRFINGRHRTALLFDHLSEIPVIFLSAGASCFASTGEIEHTQMLMDSMLNPLDVDKYFDFPTLPIVNFS
ncbi:hypothetical protein BOO22_21100 [Vibrio cidicii]|uniref:hypothetical protein n=1 Tax=Vibrio TaxID=662 RepID=UPI0018C339AE|nr:MULTISPECIES: hypothetical protein [Vibrio]EJV9415944.1 hypothetical protein [Vibrio vulnificus]MBG0761899.1 hypothetical protein [Vibrio cidicii]MCA3928816.1 hypothetical protein [Vibrio vulnificus]